MENARKRYLPRLEVEENENPMISLFGYYVISAVGGITCKLIVILMYSFSIKN